jgi:hypothetical protein
MNTHHVPALMLLIWTLVINMPGNPAPETKTGFPTKQACEQEAGMSAALLELSSGSIVI